VAEYSNPLFPTNPSPTSEHFSRLLVYRS